MSNFYPVIRLNPNDDIIIARFPIPAGTYLSQENATTRSNIPEGHKIALLAISQGGVVKRYGQIIGFASQNI